MKCEEVEQLAGAYALEALPAETLREIVRRHGTPTYAFDVGRLRTQVEKLRRHLPSGVERLEVQVQEPDRNVLTNHLLPHHV